MRPNYLTIIATSILFMLSSSVFADENAPSSKLIFEITEAEPVKRKAPKYPKESARRGQEGWVQVSYVIDKSGKVTDPVIIDSSGVKVFERSSLRAMKNWQYTPATRNGEPVQQCQMKVQLDFKLDRGVSGVRRAFRKLYVEANTLLKEKDFDNAATVLEKMKNRKIWNMYENAWFWMLDAKVASAISDEKRELASLKRAVSSNEGDRYLGRENYIRSLQRIFILELSEERYTDALDTFQTIKKQPDSEELSAKLLTTAQKLEDYMNSDQVLVRNQTIGSRGIEVHKLYRNAFGVSDINGTLKALDIRCQSKRTKFTFEEDSMWTVPASWGRCSVLFEGEEGTSFKIVEVDPKQINDNQS